ncbi:hypothetical protein [Dolichospermum compactum]|uniref:Uncharacterized protein n=1 Tax=Dolichospermum compactum NIES-806 TaxID=1973481 RepID=A0A1Z4V468_9CYAN|nr:hypothetical protein [Dolichospermum compactum]BAZ86224.1 hypothetical protein NIES806_24350 [Dolichospermum compactum NIES-806]
MTRQPNLSEVTSELEPLYSRFWQTLKGFPNFLSQGSNNPPTVSGLYQLKANITQVLQSKDPMQLLIQAFAMESN